MTSEHDRPLPPRSSASAPAVIGTLVVIAAAVVLGVVGPRLADRGLAPAGVPLSAVIDAVAARHLGMAPRRDSSRLPADWLRAVAEETSREPRLRGDLAEEGWTLVDFRAEPPRPLGALPVAATSLLERPSEALLSVTAIVDDGSIHRLDGFSRPRPLRLGERIRLDGSETTHGAAVLAVVEGEHLWILLCEDPALLDEVEDLLLGAPPDETEADRSA